MLKYKFRGQRYDCKTWIYGSLLDGDIIVTEGAVDVDDDYIGFSDEWSSVLMETVGQYTGLKDKNEKEIYEGDIVRQFADCDEHGRDLYYRMVIKWDDNIHGFCATNITPKGIDESDKYYGEDLGDYEVIGNIYENPELLEQEGNRK